MGLVPLVSQVDGETKQTQGLDPRTPNGTPWLPPAPAPQRPKPLYLLRIVAGTWQSAAVTGGHET